MVAAENDGDRVRGVRPSAEAYRQLRDGRTQLTQEESVMSHKSVANEEAVALSEPSVSRIIFSVAEAIATAGKAKGWVKFRTAKEKVAVKQRFLEPGKLSGVVGCVDGTLIAIVRPRKLSPAETEAYWSRKGFYALNCMVAGDPLPDDPEDDDTSCTSDAATRQVQPPQAPSLPLAQVVPPPCALFESAKQARSAIINMFRLPRNVHIAYLQSVKRRVRRQIRRR
ncbi:hypothetical protein HPB49_011362 [Dermacentor silvarum]|uniref:Uncharacterized protein n=1 Tax=Dermacentor silvarum TaxID=543639 RepID=A0ACB8D4U1_DERSI|nr:hypothetical protein HPB49_011362 [Dermacentor silvarum]